MARMCGDADAVDPEPPVEPELLRPDSVMGADAWLCRAEANFESAAPFSSLKVRSEDCDEASRLNNQTLLPASGLGEDAIDHPAALLIELRRS